MRLLVELSGESEELAVAEAVAIASCEGTFCDIVGTDGREYICPCAVNPAGAGPFNRAGLGGF